MITINAIHYVCCPFCPVDGSYPDADEATFRLATHVAVCHRQFVEADPYKARLEEMLARRRN